MGIFTSRQEICDKCGKLAIFDGPFSDCGCYEPKITKTNQIKDLHKNVLSDIRRTVKIIRDKLLMS